MFKDGQMFDAYRRSSLESNANVVPNRRLHATEVTVQNDTQLSTVAKGIEAF